MSLVLFLTRNLVTLLLGFEVSSGKGRKLALGYDLDKPRHVGDCLALYCFS